MRKKTIYILLVCITIFFTACNTKEEKEKGEEKDKFDIKVATNILNTYMGYLSDEDIENVKTLFSEEIGEELKDIYDTDLKVEGFKVDEINEVGKSGLFKVRVARAAPDKPMAVLDVYNIKVEKEGTEYKIGEIKSMTEKEAFLEETGLRLRQKNNVKTNLIIDIGGIPQYAYPKDDKANINKAPVPKDNFGVMNFSYSGEKLAISTYGKDAFVGVIKIDETLAVQGGAGGGGGGGGAGGQGGAAGGNGGAQGGGSGTRAKEQPIGKEISSIDLIKNGKINLMAFSLDEKFLVVEYEKPQLGKTLRVYDADSGEMVDLRFEEEFPMGKVNVEFSSFDKDVVNFDVKEGKNMDKGQSALIGKWQLNLKTEKVKKL